MNTIGLEKTFAAEHNLDGQNVPVPKFLWLDKYNNIYKASHDACTTNPPTTLAGIEHGTPTQKDPPKPQTPSAKKFEQTIEMNCMECKGNSKKRSPIGPD